MAQTLELLSPPPPRTSVSTFKRPSLNLFAAALRQNYLFVPRRRPSFELVVIFIFARFVFRIYLIFPCLSATSLLLSVRQTFTFASLAYFVMGLTADHQ